MEPLTIHHWHIRCERLPLQSQEGQNNASITPALRSRNMCISVYLAETISHRIPNIWYTTKTPQSPQRIVISHKYRKEVLPYAVPSAADLEGTDTSTTCIAGRDIRSRGRVACDAHLGAVIFAPPFKVKRSPLSSSLII
eukprot:5966714-Pleurochrysis_carterae.AAC.3